jgi:signal transduction histidine kinase
VEVTSTNEEGWFVVTVADHGRGMSAEQIQNVGGYMQFERKIHEQQGSGLGLAIAKQLTELHGGTLAIESELGKGTNVTMKIPVR